MTDTAATLRGLILSASDLKTLTDWPDVLIEDYLNIIDNLITLAGAIDAAIPDPLEVTAGGTGLQTITDGGLLLGSGVGNVTPLAQATHGQLPIGSTGADPVLATITGTTYQITVTNAAGSITLSIPAPTKITASSITLTNITAQAGSVVADLQTANDGNIFEAHETLNNPGQNIIIDFVNVTAFNRVNFLGTYEGSTSHSTEIELWNWITSAWDHFNAMQSGFSNVGTVMSNYDFIVPSGTNYIGTGADAGEVRVRMCHPMNGIADHEWFIDVVALYT